MSEHPAFQKALEELRAIGLEHCDEAVEGAVPYAIVGGRSNARWWLIPLTNRRVTVAGFSLFQPVLLSAKIIKSVTVLLITFGLSCLWVRKIIYLKKPSCFEGMFGTDDLHYSLFTGTDSPHRKSAVQVMDRVGRIKGFAKVSNNTVVKPLIKHEAETLNYLNSLELTTAFVPRVLFSGDICGSEILVTDSLKTAKTKSTTTLNGAHFDFLRELAEKTAEREVDENEQFVAGLRKQYDGIAEKITIEWRQRFEKAFFFIGRADIRSSVTSLNHGDFTPWNTFFVDGRLYVFDWEYSSKTHQSCYDLIHFKLSLPATKHQSIKKTIKQIRLLILQVMGTEDVRAVDILLLCYLCEHSLHFISRETVLDGHVLTWDGEPVIKEFIDQVINLMSRV